MDLFAHTPDAAGRWHALAKHLRSVASQAQSFAGSTGAGELAYWAGLLHDLGKASPEFQRYLRDCHRADQEGRPPPRAGSAPHKQMGAKIARDRLADPLAVVILGHHAGMPGRALASEELRGPKAAAAPDCLQTISEELPALARLPNLQGTLLKLAHSKLEADLLLRMVFSCLVDADALDTEAHFRPEAAQRRSHQLPSLAELRTEFDVSHARRVGSDNTPVNRRRNELFKACIAASELSPGVFKLTAPTGAGKTLSSLGFALHHAERHGLERVIYAAPYTSIVDQTASTFEGLFGEGIILEHHSAIEPNESKSQPEDEREQWRRLACQNWDAPLIVTTTVQLLESLFSNRPGRCRKVHRIARSVIVLDEVQTLPVKLLVPIVDMLKALASRYGATVVLCTATQPALDQQSLADLGFANVREIAPDPAETFKQLQRVTYDLAPLAEPEGWDWPRVAGEMLQQEACLTILNTRRQALELLDELPEEGTLHLSTLLCGRHRRDVLSEIHRRLEAGERCRVVSTQVVEAGVDLDFPRVLRAIGPLDRIVQAAGRCNREGRRSPEESRVTVFRPADGRAPGGSYRVALDAAEEFLTGEADLHEPQTYERFFRKVYRHDTLDARGIQKLRSELDFPRVAEKFRLITEDTVGILVCYQVAGDEVKVLIEEAKCARHGLTADQWRRVQPFLVSVRRHEFEQFDRAAWVEEIAPDLWLWRGKYDKLRGLSDAKFEPAESVI